MKIVTQFKAHILEITLCSREKIKNSMNVSTLFRFCNNERLRKSSVLTDHMFSI